MARSSWRALLGVAALLALGHAPRALGGDSSWGGAAPKLKVEDFKGKNVIVLIIDQMRQIQDFPPGWLEANMPGLARLQRNGLTFTQATCNAAMCSPSRATLFTGRFPAQHGVRWVLEENLPGDQYPQMEMPLPDQLDNMATMALNAGYEAVFKGKFHCVKPKNENGTWQASDMSQYGFERWNFPDAGANQDLSQCADCNSTTGHNDRRYIYDIGEVVDGKEGVLQYIEFAANRSQAMGNKPFFMVLSLINPHDVLFQPAQFAASGYAPEFLQGDVPLPSTLYEDLSTKPTSQSQYLTVGLASGTVPATLDQQNGYINYYANLMSLVDSYVVKTLDSLREKNLLDNTLIINTADHGEMGLSHGGQIQKDFNVYEQTLRVPFTFSNPQLWPQPVASDQLVSLVDLLPTLATLLQLPKSAYPKEHKWSGVDFSPVVLNPKSNKKVQDYTLFTFDDFTSGQPYVAPYFGIQTGPWPFEPAHVVGIREKRWKIAMYYDPAEPVTRTPPQWEFYDMKSDPQEVNNLGWANATRTKFQERHFRRMQRKLKRVIKKRLKPLPLERPIDIVGKQTNTTLVTNGKRAGANRLLFRQEADANGLPIGFGTLYTNLTLRGCADAADPRTCASADVDIVVSSRSGIIYGKCDRCAYAYDAAAGVARIEGRAQFTDGTWAFRDIKAKDLSFTQVGLFNGTTGPLSRGAVTRISGKAWY